MKHKLLFLTCSLLFILAINCAKAVTIQGRVFIDTDNDNIPTVAEGTNLGGLLYVNLIHPNGNVFASTPVGSDGFYQITGVPDGMGNTWRLVLTNTPTNDQGNRLPDTYYVFRSLPGPTNTASQTGTLPGEISVQIPNGGGNLTGQHFRVHQQNTFECEDGVAYQVAGSPDTPHRLYKYNMSTGVRTAVGSGPLDYRLNALTFSTATPNMLWAMGYELWRRIWWHTTGGQNRTQWKYHCYENIKLTYGQLHCWR
jgi:hypothetical protein